jgi:hypothetical protein
MEKRNVMSKDLASNEILQHAVKLQQYLISLQNEIDAHQPTEKIWNQVLNESIWLEKNHEIVLGSSLAFCLEHINTIDLEGGPDQGNVNLIVDATLSITKFIHSLLEEKKSA